MHRNHSTIDTRQDRRQGEVDDVGTVRLEVAFSEGKELFGWPGAAKIDESDIGKMINGSIGNGYFGLPPRSIFAIQSASLKYVDVEELDGRPALRYDYRVPQTSGAYYIKTALGQAEVEFHGSFWVNRATLDLIRITVAVDDPPAVLGVVSTSSVLDFDRKAIGHSAFLLPRAAELVVVEDDGTENQSRLSFAECHEFIGESVLKFDEPAGEPAAPAKTPAKLITLPDDFTVDFNLETPIDAATAAGGDPVHGTLRDGVRLNGGIVAPKGTRLSGRIAHLAMRGDLYYLEFTFTSLDFEGGRAGLADGETDCP